MVGPLERLDPGEMLMSQIRNALIVGGGTAGLTAAIALRRSGIDAEIVEVKQDWTVLGSGVTMMGATLRALKALGLAEACISRGAGGDEVGIYNAAGQLLDVVPVPRIAGPELPSMSGIMRPMLHEMLVAAAQGEETPVRLGVSVSSLTQRDGCVEVTLDTGETSEYDLVIGADGVHSHVRDLILEQNVGPAYTGQIVWRAVVPRPVDYTELAMFYGPTAKAGINAVSAAEAYLFLAENNPATTRPPRHEWPSILRGLLAEFEGPVADIREQINDPETIDCRPLQWLLVPLPWHRGRVVLVGDAVHASTPQLAMGAGLAIEDSVVLAEHLTVADTVEDALTRFGSRRFDRCKMVVDNSVQLGIWEQNPEDPDADPGGLSGTSWAALAAPI
jgi:2-polyprenyl-6-methoxyphenol hydroxylase-like FAD-dependent oxidoreductase